MASPEWYTQHLIEHHGFARGTNFTSPIEAHVYDHQHEKHHHVHDIFDYIPIPDEIEARSETEKRYACGGCGRPTRLGTNQGCPECGSQGPLVEVPDRPGPFTKERLNDPA